MKIKIKMLCKRKKIADGWEMYITKIEEKRCVCESVFFLNCVTNEISADGQRRVQACYCV